MSNFITNFNEKALLLLQTNVTTGFIILFIWTFAESSFFPIPPDFVMWGLVHANPDKWILYATLVTVASVTGALFGYFIGDKAGRPFLKKFIKGTEEEKNVKLGKVEKLFKDYENMAILIASLTPIPYKVFTIMGGIIEMPLKGFIFWSIIGRGLRFFVGAYLFSIISRNNNLGTYIKSNIEFIFIAIGLVFVIGFSIQIYMKRKKSKNNQI